jgi:Pyruvate/2-oxoacid:ferredoxin oxidoreductase gamma subunit
MLLCLSQKSCDTYYSSLEEGGVLIIDSTNVTVVPTSRAVEAPMTRMAAEECGNKVVTNIIALGALCGYTHVVTLDSLVAALKSTLRADLVPMNIKALHLGYAAAEQFISGLPEKRRAQIRNYSFTDTKAASNQKSGKKR